MRGPRWASLWAALAHLAWAWGWYLPADGPGQRIGK